MECLTIAVTEKTIRKNLKRKAKENVGGDCEG